MEFHQFSFTYLNLYFFRKLFVDLHIILESLLEDQSLFRLKYFQKILPNCFIFKLHPYCLHLNFQAHFIIPLLYF